MKFKKDKLDDLLHRHMNLSTVTPRKLSEASGQRILHGIVNAGKETEPEISSPEERAGSRRWNSFLAAAVAVVLMFAVSFALQFQKTTIDASAVVETGDGKLLETGRRIDAGEAARTGDGSAVLTLADGSRVEMRAHSELLLEPTSGGLRISLREGGVIINAAKQHRGHLYVQTKDMVVSVVGTVFLVNEEAEGSRVAVIEGEVHVKQGETEMSLMPGEQVMTKPRMEWQPVSEEIAWSRHAEEHLALLQQSTALSSQGQPRPAFEVASVKPVDRATMRRDHEGKQLDGAIFVDRTDLLQYIVRAYIDVAGVGCIMKTGLGMDCPTISGNLPPWIKTDRWEIQAKLPPNAVARYTVEQLRNYDTPELNQMLQVLLEDRFRLKAHRETKELPVYVLTVGKNGPKLTKTPLRGELRKAADGSEIEVHGLAMLLKENGIVRMTFQASTMQDAAQTLSWYFDRPVLDRTGLEGNYDFTIEYADDPNEPGPATLGLTSGLGGGFFNRYKGLTAAAASAALQEVGLRFESTKAPVQVLVIDYMEKPSGN